MTDAELTSTLQTRLDSVRERIAAACHRVGRDPGDVTLLAVTKTVSVRVAAAIAALGVRELGESRPQELWRKAEAIPGIHWHLTGHLQRNKLERTVPLVTLIHSVDSVRLLASLDAFGRTRSEPVPLLLEVNCGREAAKGGFPPEELPRVYEQAQPLSGIRIAGLMTMAPFYENPEQCRPVFAELRTLRDHLRDGSRQDQALPVLSMGMSHDYEIAIEEGATIVRLGTTLLEGLAGE